MKDWRVDYVICEHVAADEKEGTRANGCVACCVACAESGFLARGKMTYQKRDGLTIGTLAENGGDRG